MTDACAIMFTIQRRIVCNAEVNTRGLPRVGLPMSYDFIYEAAHHVAGRDASHVTFI